MGAWYRVPGRGAGTPRTRPGPRSPFAEAPRSSDVVPFRIWPRAKPVVTRGGGTGAPGTGTVLVQNGALCRLRNRCP